MMEEGRDKEGVKKGEKTWRARTRGAGRGGVENQSKKAERSKGVDEFSRKKTKEN